MTYCGCPCWMACYMGDRLQIYGACNLRQFYYSCPFLVSYYGCPIWLAYRRCPVWVICRSASLQMTYRSAVSGWPIASILTCWPMTGTYLDDLLLPAGVLSWWPYCGCSIWIPQYVCHNWVSYLGSILAGVLYGWSVTRALTRWLMESRLSNKEHFL